MGTVTRAVVAPFLETPQAESYCQYVGDMICRISVAKKAAVSLTSGELLGNRLGRSHEPRSSPAMSMPISCEAQTWA